jgi:serine protease AprX
MAEVSRSLVTHFLLGRAAPGELRRFTQDAGIVTDVWLSFAEDLTKPKRILLSPIDGMSAIETAALVHDALRYYRNIDRGSANAPLQDALLNGIPTSRDWTNVAPLESLVAVTLYFDELIRVVLPLTQWWYDKSLSLLPLMTSAGGAAIERLIAMRLGALDDQVADPVPTPPAADPDFQSRGFGYRSPESQVLEATSIIAMIGVFAVVAARPDLKTDGISVALPNTPSGNVALADWTRDNALLIVRAAMTELQRPSLDHVTLVNPGPDGTPRLRTAGVVQRVFLDRQSQLADSEAISTVKADAADRVFSISCASLTWAIIDCGIGATHPAFATCDRGEDGKLKRTSQSRVKATYDLTLIDRIRNFDLTTTNEIERAAVIEDIIFDLTRLPGKRAEDFAKVATDNLILIAEQLRRRLLPDWSLIEPLIRVIEDDGATLSSDHGTHVAGILAGDWRQTSPGITLSSQGEPSPQGICPDISLYDIRVLHPRSIKNTEFAVIAALEFIRYINSRAAGPPVIHGVNISLSIPHEVRNYGCGITPICVACDELVQSGVVVVAAAGNRGWDERETGFGNFVFSSITDPGNAQQVITVGATHRLKPHSYGVSYFSSRGPTGDGRLKPDLVAPGEKIRGPVRGGAQDEFDGTSMAAPFVSGAAAMLMARNRELIRDPQRIKKVLCESATDLGRERYFQGHGLVDVLRALQSV